MCLTGKRFEEISPKSDPNYIQEHDYRAIGLVERLLQAVKRQTPA